MKKLLLLIAAMAMVLSSCSKEPTPAAAIEFAGGQDDLSLNFSSQSATQTIVFSSNYDWTATPSDEWINVTPRSGQAGQECNIVVSLDANNTFEKRSGNIIINAQELNVVLAVSQAQNNAIILSTPTVNLPQSGGQFTVQLKANIDYECEIKADWIKSVETRALTDHSLRFEAKENPSQEKRVGEIVIKGGGFSETVTVTQAQLNHLSLSTTEQHFDYTGGEFSVEVQHNVDYDVKISDSWITRIESRTMETSTLNFVVAENTLYKERTATITISGGGISETITIAQDGFHTIASNEIRYTTTDGELIPPYDRTVFGAKYVSNTYANGVGTITFDAPITSIGDKAFYECSTIKSVTLPDSVTSIGDNAFQGCSSLTSVTIPDSVTSIGLYAFENCASMTSVYISDLSAWCKINFNGYDSNPISNGAKLYLNGVELSEVIIPSNVTEIGGAAFYNCTSLTSVTIPDSVTSIGGYAFYDCTSLKSVTIGSGVTSIGRCAFFGCTGELIINSKIVETNYSISNYPNHSEYQTNNKGWLYGAEFTKLTIGNGVSSIGDYAFYDCTSLTSITILDSVTSIGDYSFGGCNSLKSVAIGNCVTEVGNYAFSGCTSLTSVTIPDSVTSIGDYAFYSCTSLTSVTIGNSVTSIGGYAFYDCTSLTSVTIGNSVTSIEAYAFNSCRSLTNVYISDLSAWCKINFSSPSSNPMYYGAKLYLNGVELSEATIPSNATEIKKYAFCNCRSLTRVTIPDSVTYIGDYAFVDCSSLTSVTIPTSVTSIGYKAFYNCTSLKKVYCKPTTPPSGGAQMFDFNISRGKIYVPINSVNAYKEAKGWSDYSSYIVGYDFQ